MEQGVEASFWEVFQKNGAAMLLVEPVGGRIVEANRAALMYYGYSREELIGTSMGALNSLDWEETAQERKLALFPERNTFSFRHRLASGEMRDVELFLSPIHVDGKSLVFSIVHDVTTLKQTRQELRDSEAIYRAVFQTSLDAVAISRVHDGLIVDVNAAFLETVGYDRDEVIGRTSTELNLWVDPQERQRFADSVRAAPARTRAEMRLRKKNGGVFWAISSVANFDIDGEAYMLAVVKNISDAKAAEETIRSLAFYDPLTRLPNRRMLLDLLLQAPADVSEHRRHRALIVVDLDSFRTLNDTRGHEEGDLALQEAAERIMLCTGPSDSVARLGGDEFAVLLSSLSGGPDQAASEAHAVAQKIRAVLAEPLLLSGHDYQSGTSIGITLFTHPVQDANAILQRAEMAMVQAKSANRERIRFFSPALQAVVRARAELREDLQRAVRTEQLTVYYQPQVDCGRLVGAEALVRWHHPVRGLLSPVNFVPMAEEMGLVPLLGEWVIDHVFTQVAGWSQRDTGLRLHVSINISAHQFEQPEFVGLVLDAADRTRVDPRCIKFELTESILVANFDEVVKKMGELKSRGFSFSIDDFGTGYSSMLYLKHLPLDELKIDRTFVKDILVDATSGAIAETVISLSRAMGLSVVAEGVETEEQREYLSGLGCSRFQGYLFGRPLPAAEFEQRWLEAAQSA